MTTHLWRCFRLLTGPAGRSLLLAALLTLMWAVWATWPPQPRFEWTATDAGGLTWFADGQSVIVTTGRTNLSGRTGWYNLSPVRIFDVSTGQERQRIHWLDNQFNGVSSLSADGRWLVLFHDYLKASLWDLADGRKVAESPSGPNGFNAGCLFSADGRHCAFPA